MAKTVEDLRVTEHAYLDPLPPRRRVSFRFDGKEIHGYEGEPIAAALFAAGIRVLGHADNSGSPRGVYCGIGQCYSCRVVIDGVRNQRACIEPVREGIVVEKQGMEPGREGELPDA
ncbi:MAG: (2Fe-2S)-binding protein [Firmicutes bacterium]|nr:(2Fe-2S)-binding protein [Bacillota bacterium]